jgi:hypothetical protein
MFVLYSCEQQNKRTKQKKEANKSNENKIQISKSIQKYEEHRE